MTINAMKAWLTEAGWEAEVHALNNRRPVLAKKEDWEKLVREKCRGQ